MTRKKALLISLVVIGLTVLFTNLFLVQPKLDRDLAIASTEDILFTKNKNTFTQINKRQDLLTISKWVYKNSILPMSLAEEVTDFTNKNCHYPKLILGIIAEESKFDVFAYRKDTSVYGFGQIKYDIWKDEIKVFGVKEARDLYDWKKNILVTNYIINKYYKETGDPDKALRKYVGEVNNNMDQYCNNVLANVGYLAIIEKGQNNDIPVDNNN